MRPVLVLLLVAGCDQVLRLPDPVPPDAALQCTTDTFDPPLASRWTVQPETPPMPTADGGVLEVPYILGNAAVVSARRENFTGARAEITSLATLPVSLTFAAALLGLGVDDDNGYAIAVYSDGQKLVLGFIKRDLGVETKLEIPFDAGIHKHWRMVHVAATDVMQYFTSPTGDADSWAIQWSTAATVPVSDARFTVGTRALGDDPAIARFDDLTFCR